MSPLDSPLSEGLHVTFIKGRLADQSETLEEQYPDINPAYLEQVDALQKANEVELHGLRRELSTREIAELGN